MKYRVTYISSSDDDCCSVWTEASSPEEAERYVRSEYWDVKEIAAIRELD